MANKNIAQIKHKCIIVGIKQDMINKKGIYWGAAWAWKVNKARASKAEYVLIVKLGGKNAGEIIGVVKDPKWFDAPSSKNKNGQLIRRAYYNGIKAKQCVYNGQTIPPKFKPVRNPVRYTF